MMYEVWLGITLARRLQLGRAPSKDDPAPRASKRHRSAVALCA
jgi:hypothetical protein